jgi:hypothetical protein
LRKVSELEEILKYLGLKKLQEELEIINIRAELITEHLKSTFLNSLSSKIFVLLFSLMILSYILYVHFLSFPSIKGFIEEFKTILPFATFISAMFWYVMAIIPAIEKLLKLNRILKTCQLLKSYIELYSSDTTTKYKEGNNGT